VPPKAIRKEGCPGSQILAPPVLLHPWSGLSGCHVGALADVLRTWHRSILKQNP
jgi:hypothetical protein